MTRRDPEREPHSETAEKDAIQKTHEEFVGNESRPSLSKQEYEKSKQREKERQKAKEKSDKNPQSQPRVRPDTAD